MIATAETTADQIRAYATLAAVFASAFWFKWESIKAARQRVITNIKVDEVKAQSGVIHELVNSAMTEQKRLTWMFAQRVADDKKDPKDIALADEARKIYETAVKNAVDNTAAHRP